jgi:hypothetical protein
MTSSFMLQQRMRNKDQWSFGLNDNMTMKGQDDHYVRPFGECHPDFVAHPIGNPNGVKICVRRTDENGKRIGVQAQENEIQKERYMNGYWRGSVNLYDPTLKKPVQKWNPQAYHNRRIPWEQDLLRDDYLKWEVKYNETGLKPTHSPSQLCDTDKPYFQYGYSYTPQEDRKTGFRVGETLSDSLPEIKYDVTKLHQSYPLWKREQKFVGNKDVDKLDTQFFDRVV